MTASGTPVRQNAHGLRGSGDRNAGARAPHMLGISALVFVFWLVISASLAPVDVVVGAVLSLLLGWWSARFLWAGRAPRISLRESLALLRYLAGFSLQVLHSAIHVALVVVDPRLPIAPRLFVCRTQLQREVSRIAFAHSVSLTPGTLTVDVTGGDFLVHCLDEESVERILSGELERRIARVFERGESE